MRTGATRSGVAKAARSHAPMAMTLSPFTGLLLAISSSGTTIRIALRALRNGALALSSRICQDIMVIGLIACTRAAAKGRSCRPRAEHKTRPVRAPYARDQIQGGTCTQGSRRAHISSSSTGWKSSPSMIVAPCQRTHAGHDQSARLHGRATPRRGPSHHSKYRPCGCVTALRRDRRDYATSPASAGPYG